VLVSLLTSLKRPVRAVGVLLLLCISLHISTPPLQAATHVPACGFAEVKGIVSAADSGLPLADIDITGLGATTATEAESIASGAYTLTLPFYRDGGPYQVGFEPPNDSPYLSLAPSTTAVISGSTTMLNAVLPRGGALVGQVKTSDTGEPMVGVRVRASGRTILEDNDPMLASTVTDEEGRFVIDGLISGGYVLRYNTHDFASSEVISTYAASFVGGSNLSDAALFTVTAPLTTTVNFTIARGKTLAGEVRRSDSNALTDDIQVDLYKLNDEGSGRGDFLQSMVTDESGIYKFTGVAPGKFLLLARPQHSVFPPQLPNADLKAEWYNDASSSAEAQPIDLPVVSASVISVNLALEVGAVITGVVTDAGSGAPIAGIGIDVTPTVALNEVTRSLFDIRTDASGQYTLPGLYAGTYQIRYDAVATPYNTTRKSANTGVTVTVAAGEIHANANFSLALGGDIEGALTTDKSQPLAGIRVSLIAPATGKVLKTVTSNAAGEYSFPNIAPGEYQVKYDRFDPCGCYNSEFYSGDSPGDAALVTVEADATTAGINAGLACNAPPPVEAAKDALYLPRLDD
jgi:protocatechuate 3,4-dioxygenase beta subunit